MAPNVVMIVVDNQSTWTLGCYGNDEILTPNLDRMAGEGIRFDNMFCSHPVCSPNRATLLTGLMPSQHGIHNWLGSEKPDAQMGSDAYCTIREFVNLPQLLTGAGYNCGLTGKWHLGDSLHPQLGFRYWFTKPRGHMFNFHNDEAIWEGKVYKEPRYCIDAITDHSVDFLSQAGKGKEPFFLYVGLNGPYGLDRDILGGHKNRHTAYYADKKLTCFPREPVHPWQKMHRAEIGNDTAMRSYACAVSGVDDGVGTILQALKDRGLDEDTLVIFTADHGLCAGHHGTWGMGDHSWPMHMFQENIHIPLIMRHPRGIPGGTVYTKRACNYDFFPSIVSHLGLEAPANKSLERPGRSFAPAMAGRSLDWGEEIVFHEYENVRVVQTPQWKFICRRHPDGPDELYNLANDPGERENLAYYPQRPAALSEMSAKLTAFFDRYADPQYDLWRGGRSKAGLMIAARGGDHDKIMGDRVK